ncbi:J domain-containing protein [Kordiimonas laminariae]|uniref:J domain-containing protein n=1 Tax=Kordiimonas laminariae TaxID=2917717 RepID=UPI001FF50A62|nr:J domain-containing protein [Kordiimonas laminariae]MCK0070721.1 J domain-containing protein [Kordiimonas laminariae]
MTPYDAAKILGLSGNISPEQAKKAHREACKKYHPDINPAGEKMMKLVNEAYSVLQDFTGDVKEQQTEYGEQLNAALNAILNLSGLFVEVCGAWVWVTGNTIQHKATLKAAGYKWANKKKAWYFRPEEYRSRGRGQSSLEEIRAKYGSSKPQGTGHDRLQAS